jgi:hypothetical protein
MSFEKTISFRRFMVLNENKELQKIGDDLVSSLTAANKVAVAGMTDVETQLKVITNNIRKVIQGSWIGQDKELESLQKVAFNLEDLLHGDAKAADSADIASVINNCIGHIQQNLTSKTKSPLNNLGVDKKDLPSKETDDTMVEEPGSMQSEPEEAAPPTEPEPVQNQGMQMDQGGIPPLGQPTDLARPNA